MSSKGMKHFTGAQTYRRIALGVVAACVLVPAPGTAAAAADADKRSLSCVFSQGTVHFDRWESLGGGLANAWAVASGSCTVTQLQDGASRTYDATLWTARSNYTGYLGCGMLSSWWASPAGIHLTGAAGEQVDLIAGWTVETTASTGNVRGTEELTDQWGDGYGTMTGVLQLKPESTADCVQNTGSYSLDFDAAFSTVPSI